MLQVVWVQDCFGVQLYIIGVPGVCNHAGSLVLSRSNHRDCKQGTVSDFADRCDRNSMALRYK